MCHQTNGMKITKTQVNQVKEDLLNGVIYENINCSFMMRKDGVMLRYDKHTGKYKFFNNIDAFSRAIVRMTNRGW